MRFASFVSGGFTTMAVINPPERKLAKTAVFAIVTGGLLIQALVSPIEIQTKEPLPKDMLKDRIVVEKLSDWIPDSWCL